MARDFIADVLRYIYSEEKKENPMPQLARTNLFAKIVVILDRWARSNKKR